MLFAVVFVADGFPMRHRYPRSPPPQGTERILISPKDTRQTLVLIGHGMVGHRFCEKLVAYDTARQFRIVTFCEEPRAPTAWV